MGTEGRLAARVAGIAEGGVPERADVVVVGSGSAGLTAALRAASLGARVLVLERAGRLGGTTAISGGVLWVPCHFATRWLGAEDSRDAAHTYILGEAGDVDPALVDAFLDSAPTMARFVEERTLLNWMPLPWPDYHAGADGAAATRSLLPGPFPASVLGDVASLVVVPIAPRPRNPLPAAWLLAGLRGTWFAGRALVGGLLEGCLRLGVEVRTDARAVRLLGGHSSVEGVVLESAGGEQAVLAERGVVLASGGFEWSSALATSHLGAPFDVQLSPPAHEGEALAMATSVGAAVAHLDEAWWMPAFLAPGDALDGRPVGRCLLGDRGLPGTIVVNRRGERFANESESYSDFGRAMRRRDPVTGELANDPAWMIFDERYRLRYGAPGGSRGGPLPAIATTGASLAELARACGIDETGLLRTVDAFNGGARAGRDPSFHRGESSYDRFFGDDRRFPGLAPAPWLESILHEAITAAARPAATRLAARASRSDGERVRRLVVPLLHRTVGRHLGAPATAVLGPLDRPPYHAIEVFASSLGTCGGPRIDLSGRVLDTAGSPIPGLYAAGNAAGSPVGGFYGGAGATISAAMAFGYLAGGHAASRR